MGPAGPTAQLPEEECEPKILVPVVKVPNKDPELRSGYLLSSRTTSRALSVMHSSIRTMSEDKAEKTAPAVWQFLQWNPLLQIIDSLRQVILWNGNPNWMLIGYAWLFGLFTLLFGAWFFNRLRPAFADVL